MKLLFKQRMFSWFDSYDIYDENGATVYTVKGQLSWGHKLVIYDAYGSEVGVVQQKVFTFMPAFEFYKNGCHIGNMVKEFALFQRKYNLDYNGWHVEGNFMEWDYAITDRNGMQVGNISKEIFNWTDTYVIDVADSNNALDALMFVLAIDAEKCSRSD